MRRLRSISLRPLPEDAESRGFPFSVAAISSLFETELTFPSPVTFFVGENGSGKSTLLEALAWSTGIPTVGSHDIDIDHSLSHARKLGAQITLNWTGSRTQQGFFLRAEDFFGFAKRMDAVRAELEADLAQIDADETLSDVARGFARQAPMRELGELRRRYGDGVDTRSHGEQFLELFGNTIRPNGLYLLDEPEAPLSPNRQLSLISLILHYSREENAQFIIATHSPIVMAIPGATIYSFDNGAISPTDYDSVEHVEITRDFLNNPEVFLRHL